ncbi:sulfite exporter TauE/SafE family protein [Micrococcus lylae]|uniref:sulfite exporter TauE/SafE family protein n=1 Tax=Micrococcus lylae TaxID=1273 RepID=UPI001C63BAC1|nr:sulfite exporter TauE/SafE family protein [Micrococcus lylae]WIK81629.1 sulfite exporter TauE/SafE family protein [Micrococcus lylae]
MLWLVLILAVVVGLFVGLLGGGGSILTVPLLAYVAGLPPEQAIAGSLFVVAVTSAVALVPHARRGAVQWRVGLVFGVTSMVGALLGGLLGAQLPGALLMVLFAVMMLASAIGMIRGRRPADPATPPTPLWKSLLQGLGIGLAVGTVGAGGGFMVVPALVLLAKLPMGQAVATSVMVIAMNSVAGLGGHLTGTTMDWSWVLPVTAAAVVGALVGAPLTHRVPQAALKKGFGWFVLVMGAFVLVQEGLTLLG